MELFLKNKRVLVIGSSKGIGRSIAEGFLKEGARVMITGRNETLLTDTNQYLSNHYLKERVFTYCGDLTEGAEIGKCLEHTDQVFGGLDVLVLNIGSGKSRPGLEADLFEWERMFRTNFWGAITFFQQALPLLRRGTDANVVFIGSIAGVENIGAPIPYSAAKAAVTVAAQGFANVIADDNIRVNVIAPGNVKFPGGRWEEIEAERPEMVGELLEKKVPQKRFASPQEIADLVLFITSKRASFITGSVFTIDGGQSLRYL
jgi:3-oxoacyl-[acyl-carrier protein] reductase